MFFYFATVLLIYAQDILSLIVMKNEKDILEMF